MAHGGPPTDTDPDRYVTTDDVARAVGVSARAVTAWRHRGYGPPYVRVTSRCVRYRVGDVAAWVAARTRGGAA